MLKTKDALRKEIKKVRNCIPSSMRETLSASIHERLYTDDDWQSADSVLIYCSCRSEVLTAPLIEHALHSKQHVLVPCIPDGSDEMIAVKITSLTEISDVCRYGMLQPKKEMCKSFDGPIDLIMVPGVVFDRRGGRIGSGKGYFDQFLLKYSRSVRTGLAFACQITSRITEESHDVRMHKIFTEKEVIVPALPRKGWARAQSKN